MIKCPKCKIDLCDPIYYFKSKKSKKGMIIIECPKCEKEFKLKDQLKK